MRNSENIAGLLSSPSVHLHCQNCGTVLAGPYCQCCGQHDFDSSRSFCHVLSEALENFLHFDTKFFRNIVTLLFQPAVLTQKYLAGKRASQMPPFRLYLFVSVMFFFIEFVSGDPTIRLAEVPARPEAADTPASGSRKTPARARPRIDGLDAAAASTHRGGFVQAKLKQLSAHQAEASIELAHAFPKMLLFCLPVFALLTRLLFRAAHYGYLQHLIAAVHFHTFFFLWKAVGYGWAQLVRLGVPRLADIMAIGVAAWFVVYPLLMLRRLYQQSWPRTVFKAGILFLFYNVAIVLCFLGVTAVLVLFK